RWPRCWAGTRRAFATRSTAIIRWSIALRASRATPQRPRRPRPCTRRKRRMSDRNLERVRADLARALGSERVDVSEAALAEHAHDSWPLALLRMHQGRLRTRPACVVSPTSAAEVATVLRYANQERLPVVADGGGSGVCGGILPTAETIVVDMRRFDQLLDLNETALQATVQAGMYGYRFQGAPQHPGRTKGSRPPPGG